MICCLYSHYFITFKFCLSACLGLWFQTTTAAFSQTAIKKCLVKSERAFSNHNFCPKAAFTESWYTPAFHKSSCCAQLLQTPTSNPDTSNYFL